MPPSLPPPPPLVAEQDDGASEAARRRLAPRSRFPHFFSLPNLKSQSPPKSPAKSQASQQPIPDSDTPGLITLDRSCLDGEDELQDKYEWAILYENQRGMTIFSTPYYSSLSLLPTDPLPFTMPNTSLKRSEQPPISLSSYPLPDGDWHWVSKCWMIDMRSDSGEVQHDGFEYNWAFRTHRWRAQVGKLSAGGLVRRRRWVRLMMRPAKHQSRTGTSTPITRSTSRNFGTAVPRQHQSVGSTIPSSGSLSDYVDPNHVWLGEPNADWTRCHMALKACGRDGRKLEMWKLWLGHDHPEHKHAFELMGSKGKQVQKQWTEDDDPMPSEIPTDLPPLSAAKPVPPREHIVPVLRAYGDSILHTFIFPDSRARFLQLLASAGILPELNVTLGIGWHASETDFWSYTSDLVAKNNILPT
ncbi:hypothetical protein BD779DRAFT_1485309 [Infundibulicybe gibba]|nr:hypothetical protein BD779DRAFT_1485309 [Infundibulicybe gibba]